MRVYCQRDTRWKDQKLGTSQVTIGSHGCTITCLGMLAEMTPSEVNAALLSVNGYANGNLVIWDKIDDALPNLTCLERSTTYNNDKVADAISKYGGCLVEVNGAPIGGSKHWVLYIGNQKLVDPWDGETKPTSSYQALGFAVIAVKTGAGEVMVDSATFEELVRKSSEYDRLVEEGYVMLSYHEAKMAEKQQEIEELKETIEKYESAGSEEQGWSLNGKTVTVVEGNTTTTYNYKKE